MLDYLGKQIERFSDRRLYVSLACAFAATLCISFVDYVVTTASDPFNPYLFLKQLLITFSSYTGVALLLLKFWTGKVNRIFPLWILIAVLGSSVNVIAGSIGWLPQAFSGQSSEALWNDLDMLWNVFLAQSFITLPIAAIIYYSGAIVRGIRGWHNRPEYHRGTWEK